MRFLSIRNNLFVRIKSVHAELIRTKRFAIAIAVASLIFSACGSINSVSNTGASTQAPGEITATIANEITVFRSPTCGCCGKWIEHATAAGFKVKDEITDDMQAIKQVYGVSPDLMSCHTTIAGNYVVEGHVPIEDLQTLLKDQPKIAGIAVPGMPIGSPGMESGDYVEPYTVFSFTEAGQTDIFSEHS